MPRSPRHYQAGATYHVICRGNHQQPLFLVEDDYRYFCRLLGKSAQRHNHKIIAYCLMTNHVHLAVQVGDVGLSTIFHRLLFRYAQVFNDRHQFNGHLFQGRFQSKLVDSPQYFRALIRYIHLNPVRAGMVSRPEDHPWSSHRAYLGTENIPWVSGDVGLEGLEMSSGAYRDFVSLGGALDQLDPESYLETEGIGRLLRAVGQYFGVDPEALRGSCDRRTAKIRSIAALVAKRVSSISLLELAAYFCQVPSSVSKAASRAEIDLPASPDLRIFVDGLVTQLESG